MKRHNWKSTPTILDTHASAQEDERGKLIFMEKPGMMEVKENTFLAKLCPLSPVVL